MLVANSIRQKREYVAQQKCCRLHIVYTCSGHIRFRGNKEQSDSIHCCNKVTITSFNPFSSYILGNKRLKGNEIFCIYFLRSFALDAVYYCFATICMISNLPSYIQRLAVHKYVAIRSNIYLSRIDKLFHLLSLIMWSSNFCLHDGTLYRSLYFFCNFSQYNM